MFQSESDYSQDVKTIYSGPEGQLWELLMGEQIHLGGLASSLDLATFGKITGHQTGADFCCCSGAGMRFLIKILGMRHVTGVDFTSVQLSLGKKRMKMAGIPAAQYRFVLGNVSDPHLRAGSMDFVWGEDAWCYVADKPGLLRQAHRALKPGGRVAFSDWIATDQLTSDEAKRFMTFMKFPTLMTLPDYTTRMGQAGFRKIRSKTTPYFAQSMQLYLAEYTGQKAYDALRLLGFNVEVYAAVMNEMLFIEELARTKKIVQAYFAGMK